MLRKVLVGDLPKRATTNLALLAIRLMAGLTLGLHQGLPTFLALLNGETDYPDPLNIGSRLTMALMGTSEFICALLVAAGFLTRLTALPIVFGFCVAVFIHHWPDPFSGKELAFMYLTCFTTILIAGPGKYSADGLLFSGKTT